MMMMLLLQWRVVKKLCVSVDDVQGCFENGADKEIINQLTENGSSALTVAMHGTDKNCVLYLFP